MRTFTSLALAATLLTSSAAQAFEYNEIQPARSKINFSYQQMGVRMDGHFRSFAAQLAFDPAQPTKARAAFEVELTSIDTGSAEADQEVTGKAWFNSKAFPKARFVLSSLRPLGGNRYEVSGQLSLKGRTQDIRFPATLTTQGKAAQFEGSFPLQRADYAIGEGSWAKFDIVANEISVQFSIAANGK